MMNPEAKQHVRLPDNMGMVRSIILDHSAHPQHAILACTGRCLALISLSSDRVITCVQLPAPAHSCCWHASSTNTVYAGKCVTKCFVRSVCKSLFAILHQM